MPGGLVELEDAPPQAVQATGQPLAAESPFRRFEATLVLAIYLMIGLAALRFFRFIYNKDEIAYISIAKHYADGNLLDGVNSYWAPMLSWLLAPLLALDVEPALAAKVLGVLIGLFALLCVRRLTFAVPMRPGVRTLVLLLAVPVLLSYSLAPFTPDLLHGGLLLLYVSLVADRSFPDSRFAGAAAGLVGALLFFSKSYGLIFFLLHFPVVIGVRAIVSDRSTRRSVLRHGAVGLAVFLMLAAAWGTLLGQKYGSFTLGEGGSYNYRIVGPDSPGRPIFYMGLVEPPPPAITSVWEEPHYFAQRVEPWSPLESWTAAKHQLRLVATNGRTTAEIFQQFSMLSVTILTAAAVLCMVSRRSLRSRLTPLLWLLTIAVYASGYMLVYSEERYLWGLLLLILVLGGHLLSMLLDTELMAHRGRAAVVLGVFAATFLIHPLPALLSKVDDGREVNGISDELRGTELAGADIASSDDFGASNLVAFRLGARYWGQPPVGSSDLEAVERLRATPVRYYLVWNASPQPTHPAFTEVRTVRSGKVRLVVYSVS